MEGGSGGGVCTSGSMSTVSKEDNLMVSTEVSSYPDEAELELGLGLSLGGGGGGGGVKPQEQGWAQYGRILTAKDFPSTVSSSSSSSSSLSRANRTTVGTKRRADSVAASNNGSQVVGWPPIRAYRMNSLANQSKSLVTEDLNSMVEKSKSTNTMVENTYNGSNNTNGYAKKKGPLNTSFFVKVNMDGIPIGRKVDLSAHSCYETLAKTLEEMFQGPTTTVNAIGSSNENYDAMTESTRPSKLLDGSSDFVLTYEDKEGDWMLVGDVPWGMFLGSARRLRIMRTSDANGLAPRIQERNGRQRSMRI